MRIVSPGTAVWDTQRDARLGPVAGRLVALAWILVFANAIGSGHVPTLHSRALVLLGVVWGVGWARIRWDRDPGRAVRLLAVVAVLQALAAMIALDPGATTSWPFFLIVAVLGARAFRRPAAVAAHAGALALGAIAVAQLASGRTAAAPAHAAVLALGVLAAAALTTAIIALRDRRARAAVRLGDARRLRARLAQDVAAEPERFALLAMDVELAGAAAPAGATAREEAYREVARALLDEVRGKDLVTSDADGFSVVAAGTDVAGAHVLARRLERALADLDIARTGALNASVGIAVFPEDGRTPAELLDRAGEELRAVRARHRRLRVVPAEPAQTIA